MNTQNIISSHICKTYTAFFDKNCNQIGVVDLDTMTVDITGKFIPLSITYKFRKEINSYSYKYISVLKRKFFIEAYTAYFEADRIACIEARIETIKYEEEIKEEKPILDHLKIAALKSKKSRKSFLRKLIPIFSVVSSFFTILWRVL